MDISVWSILCNNLDINLDEQNDHKGCHFGNLKGRVGDGGDEAGSKLENDIIKLINSTVNVNIIIRDTTISSWL